jgi:hypothetical protein
MAGSKQTVEVWMKSTTRTVAGYLLLAVLLATAPIAYKIVKWKAYIWLPDYAVNMVHRETKTTTRPTHIMFVFADHYEQGLGEKGRDKNRRWLNKYMVMADRHRDSYGRKPQHTWFYAYDHRNAEVVTELAEAVYLGYGEIEFHWHHNNDTNESFPGKLKEALDWFNSFGAMVSIAPGNPVRFGFIHGNWSLDNSRGPKYCGVSRELDILRGAGCYADFTFPSFGWESQPSKINSIYYARDDDNPKSYDRGEDASVGKSHKGALMIFEGPLGLTLSRQLFEYGAVEVYDVPSASRVDSWIARDISVKGRPEWVFVKVYTHGAQSEGIVLGEQADSMYAYLERRYAHGDYRLHYVTAREAYNIVRAAEEGLYGDPDLYRNYEIKEPVNKFTKCDGSSKVRTWSEDKRSPRLGTPRSLGTEAGIFAPIGRDLKYHCATVGPLHAPPVG